MDLIQYVGSIGGIAGVLAVLMFWQYRHLVTLMRGDRRFMEDRLTQVIKDYNEACFAMRDSQEKHTQVLSELNIWLKARNGHKE